MKYREYTIEDFVKDDYFQKWVLDSDRMTSNFWNNWLAQNPDKKEDIDQAREIVRLLAGDEDKLSEADFDAMWQNIVERRNITEKQLLNAPGRSTQSTGKMLMRIAAIILALIAFSSVLYISGAFDFNGSPQNNMQPQITLELEDGTIKEIDENASGIIANTKGQNQVLQEQKSLIYKKDPRNPNPGELAYNRLTVPYGKTFRVTFSDGSYALLNSGSELRYPVHFIKGQPRNVFLDGEAFFSVAKDTSSAFTVVTDALNTQVYGTMFNVSSYKNENNTFAVLLEGSVGVYEPNTDRKKSPVKITPGQRAVFEDGKIDIEQVNVHKYTAWTNGELYFMDDRFELILKKLERHFNVQIDNHFATLSDKKFTGTFTSESIGEILKIFQAHTPFTYERNGNVITIHKHANN